MWQTIATQQSVIFFVIVLLWGFLDFYPMQPNQLSFAMEKWILPIVSITMIMTLVWGFILSSYTIGTRIDLL